MKCEVGSPKTCLNQGSPPPGHSKAGHHLSILFSSFPFVHCIKTFIMCKAEMILDFMISLYSYIFHSLSAYLATLGMVFLCLLTVL